MHAIVSLILFRKSDEVKIEWKSIELVPFPSVLRHRVRQLHTIVGWRRNNSRRKVVRTSIHYYSTYVYCTSFALMFTQYLLFACIFTYVLS